MIYWITGESGAGKTTLAKKLLNNKTIHLDGDDMRASITEELGFSKEDRIKNNIKIAKLAAKLNNQGFDIIVSTICPYEELKEKIFWITKCRFITVQGKFTHNE